MKINYKITEGNTIVLEEYVPEKDILDGLIIEHGKMVDLDKDIGHQPAITTDLTQGIIEYELPPGFDTSTIVRVDIKEDVASESSVIPKFSTG